MGDLTEIICVIDKSGSMASLKNDTIGGFNAFLEEQKKLGDDATMTVVLFDTAMRTVFDGTPIKDVQPFDDKTYMPGGGTALCDAVGTTIDKVCERIAHTDQDKAPDKVICMIITDGEENSSKEYIGEGRIQEMISNQKDKYGWEFMFLAANQDAMLSAQKMNIDASRSYNYAANVKGTNTAYAAMSVGARSLRKTGLYNDAEVMTAFAGTDDAEQMKLNVANLTARVQTKTPPKPLVDKDKGTP